MVPTSDVTVSESELSLQSSGDTCLAPRVVAIVSGSSGVGTSTIAANIVVALARSKKRVCLFDVGAGSSNVTKVLKISPDFSFGRLIRSGHPFAQMLPAGQEGAKVFPGAGVLTRYLKPGVPGRDKIAGLLESLEMSFDDFVIDLDSNLSAGTLHFAAAAHLVTVVITPDPKSLSQTFLLLKRLQQRKKSALVVQVILSMAENARSAAVVYQRFSETVKKFLGLQTEFLGSVWIDNQLASSVLDFRLVANLPITEPSCRTFFRLARRMADVFEQKNLPRSRLSSHWQSPPKSLADDSPATTSSQPASAASKKSSHERSSVPGTAAKRLAKDVHSDKAERLRFYQQLVRSLICRGKRSAYVAQLLTICLDTSKGGEQINIAEPLLGLLSELSVDDFTADQRVQLSILVKNLLGETPQYQIPGDNVSPSDHVSLPEGSPVYNSYRFGDQQTLLKKLRAASSGQFVNSLLDSIKYAAKTDRKR